MARAGDFSQSKPTVGVEQLDGSDVAVLTIKKVDDDVQYQGRRRMVLVFAEFPDRAYWPNITSIKALFSFLSGGDEGDPAKEWTGKRIALSIVDTENPENHEPVKALWVVPAAAQAATIADFDRATKKRPARRR